MTSIQCLIGKFCGKKVIMECDGLVFILNFNNDDVSHGL